MNNTPTSHLQPAAYAQPIAPLRTSACPGLLRIVPAQDGGLCRIKLPAGRLSAAQALVIAAAAERYGSGVIEITNRANLQIRGVQTEHAQSLIDSLLAAELGPSTPDGDDVRNIMVSPTLGIDRQTIYDVEPLAAQLLLLLQTRFQRLSPKFALLLDGGESVAMLEHPHDIWLAALPSTGEPLLAFGLAGCPPLQSAVQQANTEASLAIIPARHAVQLVEAILQVFLEHASIEQTRMRHLLNELPIALFLQRVQQRLSFPLNTDTAAVDWRRAPAQINAHIGMHAQRQAALQYVGAAPVLGRIDPWQLRGLAQWVNECGDATLRLTPWQSVLLPNIATAKAASVLHGLQQLGLCVDAEAALARTIACAGATGCAKGLADTKADALWLAAFLQNKLPRAITRPAVHVSGCARSCAAPHTAPFTLLAVAPGHYDLFQREINYAGFGRLLAAHCSIETAAALLTELSMTGDNILS